MARLTLVERQDAPLRCVPDLGMAHLLGQCKEKGVPARLVQGSPLTLSCLLDKSVFEKLCRRYKKEVRERGESWLKEFLTFNYGIATSDNIWDKTNPDALADLAGLLSFMKRYLWPEWLPSYMFDEIKKTRPDIVGFSLWDFYGNREIGDAVAKTIKQVREELEVPILIGGPGTVTASARKDIFKIFKPDAIVHHEGEEALFDAIRMLENGSMERLDNISYEGYDGNSKPVEDLDSLALPDFSQYSLKKFFLPARVLPLMTSRGCPWARCAFCSHHATYKGYRELSPGRLAEAIEACKKEGAEMIMFHDEALTASRSEKLLKSLPEAYYYAYTRPSGFSRRLLKGIYNKGFRVLVWGVESGSQATLDSMRKGTNIEEIERILRDAHGAGITNAAFMMFGFPGETRERAEETVSFLERNADYIERHASSQFRLEEGSPIWVQPAIWGVKRNGFKYSVEEGMQEKEASSFLSSLNSRELRTAANTMYYMPGDSEMRAYFFMQAVYGEGKGDYPVRNGILVGREILPSLLTKENMMPRLSLSEKQLEIYRKCDGAHKMGETGFEEYPYVVRYKRFFKQLP
jgi:radical SAM superfamily enzyme YgiQ (UPF0313 family)